MASYPRQKMVSYTSHWNGAPPSVFVKRSGWELVKVFDPQRPSRVDAYVVPVDSPHREDGDEIVTRFQRVALCIEDTWFYGNLHGGLAQGGNGTRMVDERGLRELFNARTVSRRGGDTDAE